MVARRVRPRLPDGRPRQGEGQAGLLPVLLGEEEAREADKARLALGPSARGGMGEASAPPAYRGDLAIIGLGGYGAAFAFPCRLLFAGECEVLHYRIRCDELPEAIEGELRSFDSEREK